MKNVVFDFHGVIYDSGSREVVTEVLEIIRTLHEEDIPLHIFTNSPIESLEEKDKQEPFLKYFENIVYEHSKPLPNSFKELFKRIGDEPTNMILIDDSPGVIKEAKNYGMMVIAYQNIEDLKNQLEKFLDISLDS
jgi:beta-phosphoglucomutase-like phosphatase (HAD superfamily)